MTLRRAFPVTDEGRIPGLRVIGFQGAVDPTSTPAQRAPVIVDQEGRLSRIADYQSGPDGVGALVESVDPPLPEDGPLPGVATRLGPFEARLDCVVAIVGKSERPLVYKIDVDQPGIPRRVAAFLRWFRDDSKIPDGAPWRRVDLDLWAGYFMVAERLALWKLLHAEIYRSLRDAVRADDPERMIAGAFWLSRVVVHPATDFYKIAEALRRAGSPHWQFMLREGLRLKDEAAWQAGLREASYAFDDHREPPSSPRLRHEARDEVRHGATHR